MTSQTPTCGSTSLLFSNYKSLHIQEHTGLLKKFLNEDWKFLINIKSQ